MSSVQINTLSNNNNPQTKRPHRHPHSRLAKQGRLLQDNHSSDAWFFHIFSKTTMYYFNTKKRHSIYLDNCWLDGDGEFSFKIKICLNEASNTYRPEYPTSIHACKYFSYELQIFYNLKPRAVFGRETSRREELQGSFLRLHIHRCPGRARHHLTVTITISNLGTDTIHPRIVGKEWNLLGGDLVLLLKPTLYQLSHATP